MIDEFDRAAELLRDCAGRVHLMGVAGVGMAGLAAHLHWLGYAVTGCDLKQNCLTRWLNDIGIQTFAGHSPRHIQADSRVLIRSTAVPASHPEVAVAAGMGIEVLRRGEVLSAIVNSRPSVAVAGSHGKTSTTAMLTQVLRGSGVAAGFFVGALVDCLGGVAGQGGDIFVAEADESDGTVAGYRPAYSILTSAEVDHLEHHAGEQALWDCFGRLVLQTEKTVVANTDDPRVELIVRAAERLVSYGFAPNVDVRGSNFVQGPEGSEFTVTVHGQSSVRVKLPVSGLHNAYNALAVCALGLQLGIDLDTVSAELYRHRLPRRRFEHVCRYRGGDIYLDYAHHPTEVRALLQSLEGVRQERVIAIFQPHRYTRTLSLGGEFPNSFHGVDHLIITPVFAASEDPLPGGSANDLCRHFERAGFVSVELASDLEAAWASARERLGSGDLLLIVGAGDVEDIATWARREAEVEV